MRRRTLRGATVLVVLVPMAFVACGFVGSEPIVERHPPGFFHGIWHGLLAPWTLVVRLFLPVKMYAVPNSGWFYDLGFLVGESGSIPVGWIAAIIALVVHFLR